MCCPLVYSHLPSVSNAFGVGVMKTECSTECVMMARTSILDIHCVAMKFIFCLCIPTLCRKIGTFTQCSSLNSQFFWYSSSSCCATPHNLEVDEWKQRDVWGGGRHFCWYAGRLSRRACGETQRARNWSNITVYSEWIHTIKNKCNSYPIREHLCRIWLQEIMELRNTYHRRFPILSPSSLMPECSFHVTFQRVSTGGKYNHF